MPIDEATGHSSENGEGGGARGAGRRSRTLLAARLESARGEAACQEDREEARRRAQAPDARQGEARARSRRGAARARRGASSPSSRPRVRAAGGAPVGAYRDPLSGHPLLVAVLPLGGDRADAVPARPLAHPREAAGAEDRGERHLPRSRDRGARRARRALDAERPPPAGGGEGARHARDHGARLARRGARLQDPRAQHREGAQHQGPQPRGDPHGAGAGEVEPEGARGRARGRVRVARVPDARALLPGRAALRGRRLLPFLRRVDRFADKPLAGEPARARGLRGAPARDRRAREGDRRGAAGEGLPLALPALVRGRADQPGPVREAEEGRHGAADADRRGARPGWPRARASSTRARCASATSRWSPPVAPAEPEE